MFDFFRDFYLESKGIDSDKASIERLEKKRKKEESKIIFSSNVKMVIYLVSVLYIISTLIILPLLFASRAWLIFGKNIIQILLAIAIVVMLMMKKKKTEMVAIVLLLIFFMLQYSNFAVNYFK